MNPAHAATPNELLAQAIDLPPAERMAFIVQLRETDAAIADEVELLLVAHREAEQVGFLDGGPLDASDHETVAYTGIAAPHDIHATICPGDRLDESSETQAVVDQWATVQVGADAPAKPSVAGVLDDEYEMLERLGAGGMGTVYRAFQRSLNRYVAVKIIPARVLDSEEQVARFYFEAESAAKLDHPGIVQVFDVGEANSMHYYAMALVEGGCLGDYLSDATRPTPQLAAKFVEQTSRAVQYAHDHAVVHRDIKPANILLATLPNGELQPKLTDFGLAKLATGEASGLTVTGQVMGTPSYMAPEQAEGRNDAITNRTDIYALGAVLYALLSGRPPFRGETMLKTLEMVRTDAPTSLPASVPLDLRTICEKCLAKNPAERYESATALADDLRRYLDGYPISARRISSAQHALRWVKRNPAIATLIGTIVATMVGATIVSTYFAISASRALAQAEANADKLSEAIDDTFVFASEDLLGDEPGVIEARRTLLGIAQGYYEELIAGGHASLPKLARATLMLGRVQASLGDWANARNSLSDALAYEQQLLRESPGDAVRFAALGQLENELTKTYQGQLDSDDEFDSVNDDDVAKLRFHAEESVRWRQKAVDADPTDVESQRLLANSQMNLAIVYSSGSVTDGVSRRGDEVRKLNRAAQKIRDSLLDADPNNYAVVRDKALGFNASADLCDLSLDSQEALDWRKQACKLLESIPREHRDQQILWLLATSYEARGAAEYELGLIDEAIASFGDVLDVVELLLYENPNVIRFRVTQAKAQHNLGVALLQAGDTRGYAMLAECRHSLVNAIKIDPAKASALNLLVDYGLEMATALEESKLPKVAIDQLNAAIDLLGTVPPDSASRQAQPAIQAAIDQLQEKVDVITEAMSSKST